jgi:hypothetical protein
MHRRLLREEKTKRYEREEKRREVVIPTEPSQLQTRQQVFRPRFEQGPSPIRLQILTANPR